MCLLWMRRKSTCSAQALAALLLAACSANPTDRIDDGGAARDGAVDGRTEEGPLPEWPACDPAATRQTISSVHVNDLHAGYTLDSEGISPYSRIRAFYESVRRSVPYAVFSNGGDDDEKGSVAELMSQGASSREALHAMGFDVRVIAPTFGAETWEVVDGYASKRTVACLHLDTDAPLANCRPR